MLILPPLPPEPNPELSPVPGPSVSGAPQIETGTSRTKAFVDARPGVKFSFRLSGASAAALKVELVSAADGSVVKTWTPQEVAARPGPEHLVERAGSGRAAARPGRYSFRLTAASADGSEARSSQTGDVQRDAFDLYDHIFPIRGPHDFGGAGARFGAGRAGHIAPGTGHFAKCGTRMVAARGGRVKFKQYHAAAGHYIVIDGDGTDLDYVYMHLDQPSPFSEGDRVYTGQTIGAVGDSGNARRVPPPLRALERAGLVRRRQAVRPAAVAPGLGQLVVEVADRLRACVEAGDFRARRGLRAGRRPRRRAAGRARARSRPRRDRRPAHCRVSRAAAACIEWDEAVYDGGIALWLERVGEDGSAVRQRHYLHLNADDLVARHWLYTARPRTAPSAEPVPEAAEEMFASLGKVAERSTLASSGWSGNRIDRLVLADGQTLIAKRIVPGSDWLGRATRDPGREALLFADGVFARMPASVDPAVVAAEPDGDAWWVVMRDVSVELVDESTPLTREREPLRARARRRDVGRVLGRGGAAPLDASPTGSRSPSRRCPNASATASTSSRSSSKPPGRRSRRRWRTTWPRRSSA